MSKENCRCIGILRVTVKRSASFAFQRAAVGPDRLMRLARDCIAAATRQEIQVCARIRLHYALHIERPVRRQIAA
jgi:hypothetical protein